MKRTLEVLNELEKEGVFSRYAIGGAMGATFYTEPVLTFDLDVFVTNYADPDSELEDEHDMRGRRRVDCMGRVVTRPSVREIASQCVLIEGAPVQFLPAYNALVKEALNDAREIMYEDVPARVLRCEHLLAICLQTGRNDDPERVRILREQAKLDANFLAGVLKRHQLEEKWKRWTE